MATPFNPTLSGNSAAGVIGGVKTKVLLGGVISGQVARPGVAPINDPLQPLRSPPHASKLDYTQMTLPVFTIIAPGV